MTRDPITVRADEPLDVVLRRMLRRRISGAPVVDGAGTLVGVITEHDLLRWQAGATATLAGEASAEPAGDRRSLRTTRASELMSHLAVSIEESMPLTSAVPILLELPYRRLPVTRHGRLVGVLSRADVLKAMAERETTAIEPSLAEGVGVT